MNNQNTIFIAMPTLNDTETEHTINNALNSASDASKIFIGVACTSTKDFYDDLVEKFGSNPNVKLEWFEISENNIGVGFGRNKAMSMYNNEDLILQIDSHTYFRNNWDLDIRTLWEEAIQETKSEKTIVTCYLPLYKHTSDQGRVAESFNSTYSRFSRIKRSDYVGLPQHSNTPLAQFPEYLRAQYENKKYFPAMKISAHFTIGNHLWAENYGLPENTAFWEEEVIQTINLLGSGFSLVFPNTDVPLCHLYSNDLKDNNQLNVSQRYTIEKLFNYLGIEDPKKFIQNYEAFLSDESNSEKLSKFHKWSKVHPKYGPTREFYIPKTYTI